MQVDIGSVVRVPLQGRRVRGWVVGIAGNDDRPSENAFDLREILTVSANRTVADASTIALAKWAALEYAGPPAAVLSWATPAPLPHPVMARRPRARAQHSVKIPGLSEAVAAQNPTRTFVRTWPGDDGHATIAPLIDALPEGKCALVVTPPGRAPHFPEAVLVGSGHDAAQTRAWEQAAAGNARVVIAGRRGPLVPIPNLGLVVVTSEHAPEHKDERTPALDARVLARRRALAAEVPFAAIGPTSPVGNEGLLYCGEGTPEELVVPGTPGRWPRRELVDLRDEPRSGGLSSAFFARVSTVVGGGGSVLVFLNRRGTARGLACRTCGKLATCDSCAGLLRPHEDNLVCEQCDLRLEFVACPSCASAKIRRVGIGVERLRNELARAFPGTPVHVAQGDQAPAPAPGEIVVGTQAAFRHRGAFDLVVITDPDALLARTGLRAREAAFHLLVDAAAAARPANSGGHLLVQTRRPDDAAMRALAKADPRIFEQETLDARTRSGLPPARRAMTIETTDRNAAVTIATDLRGLDPGHVEVLGPAATPRNGLLVLSRPEWHQRASASAYAGPHACAEARVRIVVDPLEAPLPAIGSAGKSSHVAIAPGSQQEHKRDTQ